MASSKVARESVLGKGRSVCMCVETQICLRLCVYVS